MLTNGRLHYRVVMLQPDGRLLGVIVDAATGDYVSPSANVVKEITRAVKRDGGASQRVTAVRTASGTSSTTNCGSAAGDAVEAALGGLSDTISSAGGAIGSTGRGLNETLGALGGNGERRSGRGGSGTENGGDAGSGNGGGAGSGIGGGGGLGVGLGGGLGRRFD